MVVQDFSQNSRSLLMIKPANFGFDEQTAETCSYQTNINTLSAKQIHKNALLEFENLTRELKSAKINVHIFKDTLSPRKPDAIFPNNWVSFHNDGTVILYPMLAPVRRLERRVDILDGLKKYGYKIKRIIDLTYFEKSGKFLEGTGSLVFDRINKAAYAVLSARTHKAVLQKFSELTGYKVISFHAKDKLSKPLYHTNVLMSIGVGFAVICKDAIESERERERVLNSLSKTGHEIINLSLNQFNHYCANILQVENEEGEKFLVISSQALKSLSKIQIKALEKYSKILPSKIDTIETVGGGSVRCTMAEIFLPTQAL